MVILNFCFLNAQLLISCHDCEAPNVVILLLSDIILYILASSLWGLDLLSKLVPISSPEFVLDCLSAKWSEF